MGKVQQYFGSTAVSFSCSGLLRTLCSRKIRWNSVSLKGFSDGMQSNVRMTVGGRPGALPGHLWFDFLRSGEVWWFESAVVSEGATIAAAVCGWPLFGKKATKPSSSVLIKSSSKVLTSGRAWWISSYMSASNPPDVYLITLYSLPEILRWPLCHLHHYTSSPVESVSSVQN